MASYRVLIVERRTLLRQSLAALLRSFPECEVVGEAADIAGACQLCHRATPDWILLDVALLDREGIALRQLRAWAKGAEALALGRADDSEEAESAEQEQARDAGARAYVPLHADRLALLHALHTHPHPAHTAAPFDPNAYHPSLSAREREVLELLAEGLCNKEIAHRLNIHTQTVKNHISHLLEKLAFEDRTQLAVYFTTHRHSLKPNAT
jgi:NarL family two-component system response regulator LiaR